MIYGECKQNELLMKKTAKRQTTVLTYRVLCDVLTNASDCPSLVVHWAYCSTCASVIDAPDPDRTTGSLYMCYINSILISTALIVGGRHCRPRTNRQQHYCPFLPRNALKCICAVLGSHVVRLSVRLSVRLLSVTLVICDHIG